MTNLGGCDSIDLSGLTVLVIGMYYRPESTGSAPYTADTAEHLARLGAKVHVITTHPHYPMWRRFRGSSRGWTTRVERGVTVHRAPAYIPSAPNLLRRLAYELSFTVAAAPLFTRIHPDLVIGSTPNLFSGIMAAGVSRARKKPLIQLVQDIVSSATEQTEQRIGRLDPAKFLSKLEGWALKQASVVTIPSDAFRTQLARLGLPGSKVVTVPNWSRIGNSGAIDRAHRRKDLGWGDRTVVLHTGNMGYKQGLDQFVPTMAQIWASHPQIHFAFVGDGNQRELLRDSAAGMANVELLDPVPDALYLATLQAADILLVHERSTMRDMSLPSKLTSYFAAGRPVIAVAHPESATSLELRTSGAGLVVPQGNPDEFLKSVNRVLEDPSVETELLSRAADYLESRLSPERSLSLISRLASQLTTSS